ncbi:hypothetical protein DRO61_12665 [Candidatus Bathyarchaeota archaeon]|nr:MAG: hypothetical protein DRO61_12665 [Candidatus Bathyarchaeota archaeon]
MSNMTREESLITKVKKFLERKGYAIAHRIEVDELEIYKGKPFEKKPSVIDFTQAEFLAVLSVRNTSEWELNYCDQSNKDEVFELAGKICKIFENHVSVSLDLKKVKN